MHAASTFYLPSEEAAISAANYNYGHYNWPFSHIMIIVIILDENMLAWRTQDPFHEILLHLRCLTCCICLCVLCNAFYVLCGLNIWHTKLHCRKSYICLAPFRWVYRDWHFHKNTFIETRSKFLVAHNRSTLEIEGFQSNAESVSFGLSCFL